MNDGTKDVLALPVTSLGGEIDSSSATPARSQSPMRQALKRRNSVRNILMIPGPSGDPNTGDHISGPDDERLAPGYGDGWQDRGGDYGEGAWDH
eukprot:16049534-Heterocapsa_arctica.AAC.1